MSQQDLEHRLSNAEQSLDLQRALSAALAALALPACISAARSSDTDVRHARRFEAVDARGAVVGAFGLSAGAAISGSNATHERAGVLFRDPDSQAQISASVTTGAFLTLEPGSRGSISMGASAGGAYAGVDLNGRSIGIIADDWQSSLPFWLPSGWEGELGLMLVHTQGKPAIQGVDVPTGATFETR
jgi:hypothetical protein